MVEQLQIINFKSIRDQTVELRQINLLIGQNGAGKSNFVSAFVFLEKLAANELTDYVIKKGGINDFLWRGFEGSRVLGFSIQLSDEKRKCNLYDCEFTANIFGDYQISFEGVGFGNRRDDGQLHLKRYKLPPAGKETALPEFSQRKKKGLPFYAPAYYAKYVLNYLRTLRVYHFHDTSDNARVKLPQDIFNAHFLQSEAENLAPFLYNLQQNHGRAYAEIVAAVKLVYPAFADFFLRESPFAKGKMELLWRERGNEAVLHARQLSDGTLRFICLATLLLQPPELPDAPRTLVLDEPELGLHPFALHVLAELLHKAAVHRQVVVATQSVGLLNYFTPEDLLIVERNTEGETIFARKTSEELRDWLQDYTLGQLWESNLLGGRP